MRVTLEAALSTMAEVHAVSSAIEAKGLIEGGTYHAIVCDLVMPEMTGAELYESLPVDSLVRKRFLFMTGGGLPVALQSFISLCSVPILQKPFRVDVLREAVASVLAG